MIAPEPRLGGVPHAKAICNSCAHEWVFPCDYVGVQKPNHSQAISKLRGQGWQLIKRKLYCPTCVEKRKGKPMVTPGAPKAAKAKREPTPQEYKQIFDMIAACYDTDKGRYRSGDTDNTIAEVIELPVEWITEVRERFFGPNGGNSDMEKLAAEFDAFRKDAQGLLTNVQAWADQMNNMLTRLNDLDSDLMAIKRATGHAKLTVQTPPKK